MSISCVGIRALGNSFSAGGGGVVTIITMVQVAALAGVAVIDCFGELLSPGETDSV